MATQISGFYLSILGLLYFALSIYVVTCRVKFRVGIGDGANHQLHKAIRIHGNFIEFVPIIVLLMLCLENSGAAPSALHFLGSVTVVARISHAVGIYRTSKVSIPRGIGVVGTFGILLGSSLWLLVLRLT